MIKPPPTSTPPNMPTLPAPPRPPSARPPAEWQRPTLASVVVFLACLGALMWAVHANVEGAAKALFAGVAAVLLYVTQGPRRVMPPGTSTVTIEPPPPPGGES